MPAIRDGDEYVINGQKIFVGSDNGADRIWMIVCTDPKGDRHENLSWFMIDAKLPGITVQPMELMGTGGEGGTDSGVKNTVFFDDVRVPAFALVGGENQGWTAASTHLELEHGGGRAHRPQPRVGPPAPLLPGDQARRDAAHPARRRARRPGRHLHQGARCSGCSGCGTSG